MQRVLGATSAALRGISSSTRYGIIGQIRRWKDVRALEAVSSQKWRTSKHTYWSPSHNNLRGLSQHRLTMPSATNITESEREREGEREVRNPATDEIIGSWKASTPEEVDQAVTRAREAQPAWAALGDKARIERLQAAVKQLKAEKERIAKLLTQENGRPLKNAPTSEISAEGELDFVFVAAAMIFNIPLQNDMERVILDDSEQLVVERRLPHGVVGVIAPWNYPMLCSIGLGGVLPALRMGNTCVVKPSEFTTLCNAAAVEVLAAALPEGVLQVVKGAGEVGERLVAGVDYVNFTGSQPTGRKVAQAAAKRFIPARCEMGGNDAAVVLPGTDVSKVAQKIFGCAMVNTGQTCIAIKRLYVHDEQYDEMVDALARCAEETPMGDGMQPGMVLGPMQNARQLQIVESMVDDARAEGARIVAGGKRRDGPGNFYPATIVANVDDTTRLVAEEQFGPALPVLRYSSVDDAVKRANQLNVGLGASVWGNDVAEASRVAEDVEAGTVWVNRHWNLHPMVRFCGWKSSGFGGGSHGKQGLLGMTRPKVISMQKSKE